VANREPLVAAVPEVAKPHDRTAAWLVIAASQGSVRTFLVQILEALP